MISDDIQYSTFFFLTSMSVGTRYLELLSVTRLTFDVTVHYSCIHPGVRQVSTGVEMVQKNLQWPL